MSCQSERSAIFFASESADASPFGGIHWQTARLSRTSCGMCIDQQATFRVTRFTLVRPPNGNALRDHLRAMRTRFSSMRESGCRCVAFSRRLGRCEVQHLFFRRNVKMQPSARQTRMAGARARLAFRISVEAAHRSAATSVSQIRLESSFTNRI